MRQRKIKARKHGDSNRPHLKFVVNYREAGNANALSLRPKSRRHRGQSEDCRLAQMKGRHAGRDRLRMHLEPDFIPVPLAEQ